ncbi:MAG: hypothetical protein ACPG31_01440 [Planctomycetota bacterium]
MTRPYASEADVAEPAYWRQVLYGLLLGAGAVLATHILCDFAGALFLPHSPYGVPRSAAPGFAGSLFLLTAFSMVAAGFLPPARHPDRALFGVFVTLAIPVVLAWALDVLSHMDLICFVGGGFCGLTLEILGRLVHQFAWPPFSIPKMLRRFLIFLPLATTCTATHCSYQNYPCVESRHREILLERGEIFLNRAIAYYAEHGVVPTGFHQIGHGIPSNHWEGWWIDSHPNHFNLTVGYGTLGKCKWMVSGGVHGRRYSDIAPDAPALVEANQLMRWILGFQQEHGRPPSFEDDLGLAEDWGTWGPWRLVQMTRGAQGPSGTYLLQYHLQGEVDPLTRLEWSTVYSFSYSPMSITDYPDS